MKLTDKMLTRIAQDLLLVEDAGFADAAVAAIRELRDRAKLVASSAGANHCWECGEDRARLVPTEAVVALMEVLP